MIQLKLPKAKKSKPLTLHLKRHVPLPLLLVLSTNISYNLYSTPLYSFLHPFFPSPSFQTLHDKIKQQNILNFLIEEHGAKIAHVITYLRRLWGDNPQAKILMFSQVFFPSLPLSIFSSHISLFINSICVVQRVLVSNV